MIFWKNDSIKSLSYSGTGLTLNSSEASSGTELNCLPPFIIEHTAVRPDASFASSSEISFQSMI